MELASLFISNESIPPVARVTLLNITPPPGMASLATEHAPQWNGFVSGL